VYTSKILKISLEREATASEIETDMVIDLQEKGRFFDTVMDEENFYCVRKEQPTFLHVFKKNGTLKLVLNLEELKISLAKISMMIFEGDTRPVLIGYKPSEFTGFYKVVYYVLDEGKLQEVDFKKSDDLAYNHNLQTGRENYAIPVSGKAKKVHSFRMMEDSRLRVVKIEYFEREY
jgi:hypothetical protein